MRTKTVKVRSRNKGFNYAAVGAGVEWFNILLGCVSQIVTGLPCNCNDIAAPHFSMLLVEVYVQYHLASTLESDSQLTALQVISRLPREWEWDKQVGRGIYPPAS